MRRQKKRPDVSRRHRSPLAQDNEAVGVAYVQLVAGIEIGPLADGLRDDGLTFNGYGCDHVVSIILLWKESSILSIVFGPPGGNCRMRMPETHFCQRMAGFARGGKHNSATRPWGLRHAVRPLPHTDDQGRCGKDIRPHTGCSFKRLNHVKSKFPCQLERLAWSCLRVNTGTGPAFSAD